MHSKHTKDESAERGVSPVIGVILMVAITVILAAVIAAFVLDLGQSSGANPSAAFTYDHDGDDTIVTLNNVDRLDEVRITGCTFVDGDSTGNDPTSDFIEPDVGDRWAFSSCSPDDITIVGKYDGNEAVL